MSEDKTVLLSIKLDTGDLKKNSEVASAKILELKKKQSELDKTTKEGALAYAKLGAEIKAQNHILTQSSKAIEINERLGSKQNLSLKEQAELLSAGKVALRNLTSEQISNTDAGKQLNKEVSDLNESLKKSEKAYGDNQRDVGNYGTSLADLKRELKTLKGEMVGLDAGSEKYQQASEKAGKLGDKIKEVNENVKASSGGTGFEKLSNNLGLVQDDLMNLDFAGVSEKMKQMAVISKGMTFKEVIGGVKSMGSALLSLGKAILMNPMFIMVGVIVAIAGALKMWSDTVNERAVKAQENHTASIQRNIDKMIAQNKKREEIAALELKLLELDNAGAKKIADKKTKDLYQSEAERLALIKEYQLKDKDLRREFNLADDVESKKAVNEKIKDNNSLLKELGESFIGYKQKRLVLEKENNKDIKQETKKSDTEKIADAKETAQKILDSQNKLIELQLSNEELSNENRSKLIEARYKISIDAAGTNMDEIIFLEQEKNKELDALDKLMQEDALTRQKEAFKKEKKEAEGDAKLIAEIKEKNQLEIQKIGIEFDNKKKERDLATTNAFIENGKITVEIERKTKNEILSINAELNYLKEVGTTNEVKAFQDLQDTKIQILKDNAEKEIKLGIQTKELINANLALDVKKVEDEKANYKVKKIDEVVKYELTEEQKVIQKKAVAVLSGAEQLSGAISQIQQNRIANELLAEQNKNDENQKQLQAQLDAGLISQAQFNSQKSDLDAKFKAEESKLKREAFEKEKAAAIIKSIINTAIGVTAAAPVIPLMILTGVLGAVETGLIASQPTPKFAKGGTFGGSSHANGGTRGVFSDGTQIEVERDENFYILNKNASRHINGLSNLNQQFGGIPLMANGGAVTSSGITASNITNGVDANLNAQNQLIRMIELMPKPVVIVQDINDAQGNLATVENRANF
jgi:hypothetical protein